jgi:hypothetical protein
MFSGMYIGRTVQPHGARRCGAFSICDPMLLSGRGTALVTGDIDMMLSIGGTPSDFRARQG